MTPSMGRTDNMVYVSRLKPYVPQRLGNGVEFIMNADENIRQAVEKNIRQNEIN